MPKPKKLPLFKQDAENSALVIETMVLGQPLSKKKHRVLVASIYEVLEVAAYKALRAFSAKLPHELGRIMKGL